jgi:hypothetical protein
MREVLEPLIAERGERCTIVRLDKLTSGSDIGLMETILIGSSPRLGSVTRMED